MTTKTQKKLKINKRRENNRMVLVKTNHFHKFAHKRKAMGREVPWEKIAKVFRELDLFPPEVHVEAKTCGIYLSAATTNSQTIAILSNSLLASSHGMFNVGQTEFLEDFAKNYASYRVDKYSVKLSFVSRTATSRVLYSIQHLGELPSYGTGADFNMTSCSTECSNRVQGPFVLQSITAAPCRHDHPVMSHKITEIIAPMKDLDPGTVSGTITNGGIFVSPSGLSYVVIHLAPSPGGTFTANEIPLISVELVQDVVFFDRRALA